MRMVKIAGGKKRSLLVNYLATNLSLAVFACAIVGLILFSFSIREMNHAYEQEQLGRLQIAADDLQRQKKLMEGVALDIRFDEIYRPAWFGRDATYEVELVKALEKYQGVSPLVDTFFLLYRDTQNVYYPLRKNYFSIYMNTLGVARDTEALYQQFVAVRDSDLIVHSDGRAFFCYNLPMSKQTPLGDAVLVFCVNRALLLERMETVMGLGTENLFVYYDGRLISADEGPDGGAMAFAGGLFRDANRLAAQSADGRFTVLTLPAASGSYAILANFRTLCLWIFGAFALAMVALACFAAYRNYRPIDTLMRSYAPNSRRDKNELEQINRLLSSSMESREKAQEMLVRQMDELESQRLLIRRQLLLLLLSGNWDIPQNETRDSGCLPLPMPCYGLLALRLEDETDADALCKMIEELSDPEMILYATPLQDTRCVVVLVNLEEKALLALAADLIEGVRDAANARFDLLPGEKCDHVGELSSALVRIFTRNAEEDAGAEIPFEKGMEEAMQGIRAGETEEALARLEGLLSGLPKAYPSLMICRYVYAGVFNTLLETARQEGVPIDDQRSVPSLLTEQETQLRSAVLALAREISTQQESKGEEPEAVKGLVDQSIQNYIDQNLLDWNLSLDSVSEAVGVSTRQISRILRRWKNTTYKEYVTGMRMERAKELLTVEKLSVAETSQRVCYASVSYFIKTFRQYTGMTPANYKLLTKCGAGDDRQAP